MEDKTQYVALIEELQKIANDITNVFTEFGDILAEILPDVEIPDEEEDTWEMKCPYKYDDEYFIVELSGRVGKCSWDGLYVEEEFFNQGHIFLSEEEAVLEAKRRNLLTRFRAFRDECNGGWKPDWSNRDEKWEIGYKDKEIKPLWTSLVNAFPTFGHFKNEQDAERAIELFGNEIKELFMDGEED